MSKDILEGAEIPVSSQLWCATCTVVGLEAHVIRTQTYTCSYVHILCYTHTHTYTRSPWRIIDDCGAAFAMGCIGGGVFSFWKGYRNSPVVCVCVHVRVYNAYVCVNSLGPIKSSEKKQKPYHVIMYNA